MVSGIHLACACWVIPHDRFALHMQLNRNAIHKTGYTGTIYVIRTEHSLLQALDACGRRCRTR